jgi:Holliday junction DNA helicase RuvB
MSRILNNDRFLDSALRPASWDDYIGQKGIKDNLKILLQAAAERSHPPEHLLFYGPPGLGKTTLAHLIAKESGGQLKLTSGPAIEKSGDLASILTNLTPGDILFIDEAHRLNKNIEEVLYPAMEAGTLNIVIGKGMGAKEYKLDLPPFTLVAATTRVALLSAPLRSRFSGGTFRLDFYTEDEIKTIIMRSAKILEVPINEEAAAEIARRSRFVAGLFLIRNIDIVCSTGCPAGHAIKIGGRCSSLRRSRNGRRDRSAIPQSCS